MRASKPLLLAAIAGILVMSSCSQQRYASRAKVKVNQEARKTEKQKSPEQASVIESKKAEMEAPSVHSPAPGQEMLSEKETTLPSSTQSEKAETKVLPRTFRGKLRSALENPSEVKEKVRESKEQIVQDVDKKVTEFGSKWFKLMLIGLVVALVGIILGIWIIYTLGAILAIVSLVLWILEMAV